MVVLTKTIGWGTRRVQVKSVKSRCFQRKYYQVTLMNSRRLPVSIVKNRTSLYVTPKSKKSRYEEYREAWDLMRTSSSSLSDSGPVREATAPGAAEASPNPGQIAPAALSAT